jgi:anti-sigma regulatory factor (Ser/Thr protein kinase)
MDTLTRPPGTGACSVELDAIPEAVRAARSYVSDVLSAWAMPADLIDMATLLTSELASNAITHGHGQGGTFTLEVRSFGCCLSVDVADRSLSVPVLLSPAGDSESGRGLLLIAQVADSWGYYFAGERKHVWFHLAHACSALSVQPPQPVGHRRDHPRVDRSAHLRRTGCRSQATRPWASNSANDLRIAGDHCLLNR